MFKEHKNWIKKTARLLFKKGLSIIPLKGKVPVRGMTKWERHSFILPTQSEQEIYIKRIDDAIGIVFGEASGLIGLDIDSEDEEELRIINEIIPPSPIRKKGKKGETHFYLYNCEKPEKIKTENGMAVELLSTGNQAAIPPSIHPETGKPYFYLTPDTLENFDLKKLPTLPPGTMNELRRRLTSNDRPSGLVATSGRNEQLKSMASAMLHKGEKTTDEIAEDLLLYDKRNHRPPLFSDKSEGICKADPFSNAAQFVVNIRSSICKGGEVLPHPLQVVSSASEIEVLSLGEFLEPDRFPPRIPVIEGLMNQQEFHLFSAPAKAGKTLMQLNLALAVARGGMFLGRFKTTKGKVLIIQTEVAGINFQQRMIQATNGRIEDIKDMIFISSNRIKLDTKEGIQALKDIISQYGPSLVVLDPFYTLHNSNEDSSSEIAPILSDLRDVIIKTNTTCLLIHHQGKGGNNSQQPGHKHRGSSSFADVPDGSWSLSKTNDPKAGTLSFELRNLESPLPLSLYLDDNLTWCSHEFSKEPQSLTIDAVEKLLSEKGAMKSGELVSLLVSQHGISKKTAQNKMKEALSAKVIQKKKDGKCTLYSSVEEKFLGTNELPSKKTSADVKSVGIAHLPLKNTLKNQDDREGVNHVF